MSCFYKLFFRNIWGFGPAVMFHSLFAAFSAFAQVSMNPNLVTLGVSKGARKTFELRINNTGENPESCTMSALNMDIGQDGAPFASDSSYSRSQADWLHFQPESFVLDPHSEQVVTVTVTVPREAVGTYCAMYKSTFSTAVVPGQIDEEGEKETTLEIGRSWAGVVLITVRSFDNVVQLEPRALRIFPGRRYLQLDRETAREEAWKIEIPLCNTGNTASISKGSVRLFSESGILVESTTLEAGRGYVLPERIRLFSATGRRPLPDGLYFCKVAIQSRGARTLQHSTPFGVYKGEIRMNVSSESLKDLLRAATPGFQIRRQFIELSITETSTRYGSILLKNLTRDTLTLFARPVGWWVGEKGNLQVDNKPDIRHRCCVNWMSIPHDKVSILPRGSQSFRFLLQSPESLDGEYYAGITFDHDRFRPDLPTELVAGRTCFISASDKKSLRDSLIVEDIRHRKNDMGEDVIVFTVINLGNGRLDLMGRVSAAREIAPEFFKPLPEPKSFGNRGNWVMPESKRNMAVTWPNLQSGRYEVTIDIGFPGDADMSRTYKRILIP